MPLETILWVRRLKEIEHEYRVARIAMNRLAFDAGNDPLLLDADMRVRGIGVALDNLGGTYAIRLFAEFEAGLRHFWVATRIESEPSRVAEIIDRVAARHGIGHDERANVHRGRGYRNRLIHDHEEEGEMIEVKDLRSFLCVFLGKIPLNWEPPVP